MTTHAHPRPGQTVAPCCLTPPASLPIGDRLTFYDDRVDCGGRDAREGASGAQKRPQNAMTGRAGVIGRTDDRKAAE